MADKSSSVDTHHQSTTDKTSSTHQGSTEKNAANVGDGVPSGISPVEITNDVERDGSGPGTTPGSPKRSKKKIGLIMTALGVSLHASSTSLNEKLRLSDSWQSSSRLWTWLVSGFSTQQPASYAPQLIATSQSSQPPFQPLPKTSPLRVHILGLVLHISSP